MSIFTENPVPIVLIGILILGSLITFGVILSKREMILGGIGVGILTVLFILLELAIVTNREQVHSQVLEMARCVRKNDVEGLLEFTVDNNNNPHGLYARNRIKNEMPDYFFKACRLNNIRVDIQDDGIAEVKFLAFVTVDATKRYNHSGMARGEVMLKFQKQPDESWKVIYFNHWEPMSRLNL